jgi:general secretion pathway protein N
VNRVWRYLAIGVTVYLLVLISTLPATRITTLLESRVADLSLHAVTGSVFSGQAQQLVYQGLGLGTLRWQFRPAALLLGRAEYRVELSSVDNHGRGNMGMTLAGRLYGRELELTLLPDRIINHYSPVATSTSGELNLVFETLDFGRGLPRELAGRIIWQDAAVLEPVDMVLGDVEMALLGSGEALAGSITRGGVLGASGDMALLPDSHYRVDLVLRPGNDVSAETLDLLENYARMQANGDYLINASGQL